MSEKENKVFLIIFYVIVLLLSFAIVLGKFCQKFEDFGKKNHDQFAYNTIDINWMDLFPYDEINTYECFSQKTHANNDSKYNKICTVLKKMEIMADRWIGNLPNYKNISKLGYLIKSTLTDPAIGTEYVKLKNGYWIQIKSSSITDTEAREIMINYSLLQTNLKEKGIEFLFVIAPSKECAIDDQLPNGITSHNNDYIDTCINALKSFSVNFMDLRKQLHNDNLNHYSLFYKTDHHWNIDAGFWATSQIENELSKRFKIYMDDVNSLGSYHRVTYKNAVFGSAGQYVTHYYAQSEDFDILLPDFENLFSLEIPDLGMNKTGSFEDIFINYQLLDYCVQIEGGLAYDQILYGNRPYVRIQNMANPNGPKILMIRDSFSLAVAPYLALSCSEMILLDVRSARGNFTGSIINCINQFKPDVVIALESLPHSIKLNKD